MSGENPVKKFALSLFKQQTDKSTSKSTADNDKNKLLLDKATQVNIKIITDNVLKINNTLNQLYKNLFNKRPDSVRETSEKEKEESKTKKNSSKKDSGESKLSKKKQKEITKGQKKVNKKLNKDEDPESMGKKLESLQKLASKITGTIGKLFSGLAKNIATSLTDSVETASKYITSSSIKVDKSFRSMQLGMGLSNQGAMSLSGAMNKIGIEKSDLAYLTQGQRDALNDFNSMFNKLYDNVDMSAISKLGNDIFVLMKKYEMIIEAVKTNVMNILTSLTPVIEFVTDVLGEIFDTVNNIFASPQMKSLMENISLIAKGLVNTLMPIVQKLLNFIGPAVTMIVGAISQILEALLPTIELMNNAVGKVLDVLISIFEPLLNIVTKALTSLANIITEVMNFMEPILNMLLDSIGSLLNSLMPFLEMIVSVIGGILTVISNILKPIITIIANVLSTIMDAISSIFTFLQPIFETITSVLDAIMPVINVIGDMVSQIFGIFMQLFGVIIQDLVSSLKPIIEIFTTLLQPVLLILKPFLKAIAWILSLMYSVFAVMFNAIIAIRNAIVWWDKKDYLDPTLKDVNVELEAKNNMVVDAKSGIASTYASNNNTSSISNQVRETKVTATYNQTISGTASAYAQELQKQNYESNQVLAELVEGAL